MVWSRKYPTIDRCPKDLRNVSVVFGMIAFEKCPCPRVMGTSGFHVTFHVLLWMCVQQCNLFAERFICCLYCTTVKIKKGLYLWFPSAVLAKGGGGKDSEHERSLHQGDAILDPRKSTILFNRKFCPLER